MRGIESTPSDEGKNKQNKKKRRERSNKKKNDNKKLKKNPSNQKKRVQNLTIIEDSFKNKKKITKK